MLEAFLLAISPVAAFFGLRLTLMAPPDLNDPAMHTTFIVDPQDIFLRYAAVFQPTERLREGARVGFLIPGRIAYLLFGGVPGFVVFRYVLALIAVVPTYLLLKRLYSSVAGVIGVIIILSCPVIILAWGTDFPELGRGLVSDRRPRVPGHAVGTAPRRLADRFGGAVHDGGLVPGHDGGARARDSPRVLARPATTRPAEALAGPLRHGRRRGGGHRSARDRLRQ